MRVFMCVNNNRLFCPSMCSTYTQNNTETYLQSISLVLKHPDFFLFEHTHRSTNTTKNVRR